MLSCECIRRLGVPRSPIIGTDQTTGILDPKADSNSFLEAVQYTKCSRVWPIVTEYETCYRTRNHIRVWNSDFTGVPSMNTGPQLCPHSPAEHDHGTMCGRLWRGVARTLRAMRIMQWQDSTSCTTKLQTLSGDRESERVTNVIPELIQASRLL